MSEIERHNKGIDATLKYADIRGFKELELIGQAVEDSLTAEQEIEARDMRIEQLEHLNNTLAKGYDGAMRDYIKIVNELEYTREALRLVIRRQLES